MQLQEEWALSHPRAVPQHWPLTLEEAEAMETDDLMELGSYADFSYLTELFWKVESTWYNSPELRPSLLGVTNTYFIYKFRNPLLPELYSNLEELEEALNQLREHHPQAQELISTGSALATYLRGVLSVQHYPLMRKLSELLLRLEKVEGKEKLERAYATLLLFPASYGLEELRRPLRKLELKLEKLELAAQDNLDEASYLHAVREEARDFSDQLEVQLLLEATDGEVKYHE